MQTVTKQSNCSNLTEGDGEKYAELSDVGKNDD